MTGADYSRLDGGIAELVSANELRLDLENAQLRQLLAQAGIDAAKQKVMEGMQRLLLEELHHRIKNVLATVMAIDVAKFKKCGQR